MKSLKVLFKSNGSKSMTIVIKFDTNSGSCSSIRNLAPSTIKEMLVSGGKKTKLMNKITEKAVNSKMTSVMRGILT